MRALRIYARRLAGLVAACLALVLVAAPAASAAVCAGEPAPTVAVQSDAAASAMPGQDQAPDEGRVGGTTICLHCHCHQSGALPTPLLPIAAMSMTVRDAPAVSNARRPISRTFSRVERPPRV